MVFTRSKKSAATQEVVARKEGQLAVDIYETAGDVVIVAPIAGVSLDGIDISIADDVITIKGERLAPDELPEEAFYARECFWGPFSRSVVLPTAVDIENIKASFKDGILKIKVPKQSSVVHKTIHITLD